MKENKKVQMRKQNMKLFSFYKTLSWDFLYHKFFIFDTSKKY